MTTLFLPLCLLLDGDSDIKVSINGVRSILHLSITRSYHLLLLDASLRVLRPITFFNRLRLIFTRLAFTRINFATKTAPAWSLETTARSFASAALTVPIGSLVSEPMKWYLKFWHWSQEMSNLRVPNVFRHSFRLIFRGNWRRFPCCDDAGIESLNETSWADRMMFYSWIITPFIGGTKWLKQ